MSAGSVCAALSRLSAARLARYSPPIRSSRNRARAPDRAEGKPAAEEGRHREKACRPAQSDGDRDQDRPEQVQGGDHRQDRQDHLRGGRILSLPLQGAFSRCRLQDSRRPGDELMPLSSRRPLRMASLPAPGVQTGRRHARASTNRRIKPRSVASAAGRDRTRPARSSSAGEDAGDQAEPGQPDRPAAKLGGPVEPFLDPQGPDHAPVVAEPEPEPLESPCSPSDGRRLATPPAASQGPGSMPRPARPRRGCSAVQSVRVSPRYSSTRPAPSDSAASAISGGQIVGHARQDQQPVEQRPGRIELKLAPTPGPAAAALLPPARGSGTPRPAAPSRSPRLPHPGSSPPAPTSRPASIARTIRYVSRPVQGRPDSGSSNNELHLSQQTESDRQPRPDQSPA